MIDEQSFVDLYRRTARPLWAYLHRMSGNAATADELLQEVFYRLLRASPELEPGGEKSYLFRIATNLLRDWARTRTTESLMDEPASNSIEPKPDLLSDLRRLLHQVGERERQLLWLAYAEGFSHREIAATTGLKEASIRPLLFRARQKFIQLLRGSGYAERVGR